jgi:murein DD-endopeptidase MepM/ murein hydrolase activator NlpD
MRTWVLRTLVGALAALLVGIVLFFIFYGHILSRAARTERVLQENERLKRYQFKVQLLEGNLAEARHIVGRLTELAGIDYQFPEIPDDSILFASLDGPSEAVLARGVETDLTWPSGLPMRGFITQDFEVTDPDRYHPGIDIACAVGSPVLATAAGVVEATKTDSVYGKVVVLRHSDSVTTVYGHNDEILVAEGQEVMVGSRIALSGNTGISTAPHLHYEVRIHDEPVNPLEARKDYER